MRGTCSNQYCKIYILNFCLMYVSIVSGGLLQLFNAVSSMFTLKMSIKTAYVFDHYILVVIHEAIALHCDLYVYQTLIVSMR